ncbi:ArnT family glycosyltransferase [Flaviaesturariibacter amylovorans]|uniref:Glycosyltransferase RgtA/B/C/D-like domain-containing protein n=1 Tax=Flaviaesturariibacter amylovorans TaxID=1084520 RepID=A0ABP8HDH0_9BACT
MALSPNYRSRLIGLIVLGALLRLVLASVFELGNDEVYYWTYARRLQWNYFDHPPLVGLWIRLSTWNLGFEWSEAAVRLGSILSCAGATALLFHTVRRVHSARAGWYAALLYNASVYASIIAGLFILPDSPQMLFWCAALHTLVSIDADPKRWKPWLLFGLLTGLTILSKVHGAFLWLGLGLYILARRRTWLARPQLYVAALFTAALASPILLWNIQNDFITYRFHSGRVTVQDGIHLSGFGRELGGQFLYNNPVIVVGTVLALLALRKRRFAVREPLRLFTFIALPMIGVLLAIALFRDTLPHWSGPAWVTLLPLTAIFLATRRERPVPRLPQHALAFTGLLVAVAIALTFAVPGTLGKKDPKELGFGDFTLDLHGWREAGPEFAALYLREKNEGRMPAGAPLVAHRWFPAAHLEYYFAAPNEIPVLGLGDLHNIHHYAWRNRFALHAMDLTKAWCVVPSNEWYDARTQFREWYAQADSVTTITQTRGGQPARYFTVWRLSGLNKKAAVPVQGKEQ